MADADEDQASLEDICFIAIRRPAMLLGVPATGCLINVTLSVIVGSWIGVGSWHILIYIAVLMPTGHMLMRFAVARDYNWFRTKALYLETKARAANTNIWGGSSLNPLPGWPKKAADLPISGWGGEY